MLIDAILGILSFVIGTIFSTLLALIPSPPGWFLTAVAEGWALMEQAYTLDHWLPVDLALIVIATVLGAYVVSVSIGVVRLVVSYFTLGSGAT